MDSYWFKMIRNGSEWISFRNLYQDRSMQISLKSIQAKFSIQIKSEVVMIRIHSDWKFGTDQPGFEFIQFEVSDSIEWIRIEWDWFPTDFHQTKFEMLFGLVRNDSKWLRFNSFPNPNSDSFDLISFKN